MEITEIGYCHHIGYFRVLISYVFLKLTAMKRLLTILAATFFSQYTYSQIIITAADMPVAHDTFIYSNVATSAAISPADSGANTSWSYNLVPTSQGMDLYQTTAEISPILSFTLPSDLYGYKFADGLPSIIDTVIGRVAPGITISSLYDFFEKIDIPPAYVASAFAATINTFPVGTNYTDPDVWYLFPLTYGSSSSNYYSLPISIPSTGGITETGYRNTTVDGWGTITTPYYTTPVNCIRVRSEIHEIDSISFGGTAIGFPNNSIQYKWLVNGDHFPALWVVSQVIAGTELITSIKYRDRLRDTSLMVHHATNTPANVSAFPNPSANGIFTLSIPSGWASYHVDVFNVSSAIVASQDNKSTVDIQSLPAGIYYVPVLSGTNVAYVPVVK